MQLNKQEKAQIEERNKLLPFCPEGTKLPHFCPMCGKLRLVQDGQFVNRSTNTYFMVYRCLDCQNKFNMDTGY